MTARLAAKRETGDGFLTFDQGEMSVFIREETEFVKDSVTFNLERFLGRVNISAEGINRLMPRK